MAAGLTSKTKYPDAAVERALTCIKSGGSLDDAALVASHEGRSPDRATVWRWCRRDESALVQAQRGEGAEALQMAFDTFRLAHQRMQERLPQMKDHQIAIAYGIAKDAIKVLSDTMRPRMGATNIGPFIVVVDQPDGSPEVNDVVEGQVVRPSG